MRAQHARHSGLLPVRNSADPRNTEECLVLAHWSSPCLVDTQAEARPDDPCGRDRLLRMALNLHVDG